MGGIVAYLYHMGDEFSKQIWYMNIHMAGLTSLSSCLWNSKWKWDKEILYVIYNLNQFTYKK